MLGIGATNLAVLIAYLIGVTLLGAFAARKVRGLKDFIMPRRFGKWMMTMHAFGTGTHSDQAVSVASKTFTNGVSGIWYQWLYLFGTPFYWLIAPMLRRFRALTTADIFELRFNRSVAALYSLISIGFMVTTIGLMLKGSGAVISGASQGAISPTVSIALMTFLFVIYGSAGGLAGAIVTDFLQGILTIAFSFLLIPFVLGAVGGIDGIRDTLNDPSMLSLVAPSDIGFFYIAMIAVNGLVGIVVQPHILANCSAGRTEKDGQIGFVVGSFVKRFCTVAWTFTGLAGAAYYIAQPVEPDHLYGLLANEFLPLIAPGLLGLFLATLLASVMSSCDSFMIAASALFTENLYKPLRPRQSKEHYLFVARISSVVLVIAGVVYAYQLSGVIEGLEIIWKIGPMMGIAFWLGFFWKRTTVAGAWASTLSALFAWWLTNQSFFLDALAQFSLSQDLGLLDSSNDELSMRLPWQMLSYLTFGTLIGVLVSLFTRSVEQEKLQLYYALQSVPVNKPEPEPEKPCTLPEGTEAKPLKLLFPNSNLMIAQPTRRSVVGFLVCASGVAGIIVCVYWITLP